MERLAICAIFKDEARYILEWIQFHRTIGFTHFVLYDNGSTDAGAALVTTSQFADCVTIVPWPERPGQIAAYQHFISTHAVQFDWVAFIDTDEFIHPVNVNTIYELLPSYAAYSAVLINWMVFGPSGFVQRPEGSVVESYTQRVAESYPVNCHVKTLARCTNLLSAGTTPHTFEVQGPCCDAAGRPAPNLPIQSQPCHDRLVLNHYFTKSQEDWEAKVDRGKADTLDGRYPFSMFTNLKENAAISDRRILRFRNGMMLNPHQATQKVVAKNHMSAMDFWPSQFGALYPSQIELPILAQPSSGIFKRVLRTLRSYASF